MRRLRPVVAGGERSRARLHDCGSGTKRHAGLDIVSRHRRSLQVRLDRHRGGRRPAVLDLEGAADGLRGQAAEASGRWLRAHRVRARREARTARPIGTSYKPGRVARVGLNCATCHVGTYRESPDEPAVRSCRACRRNQMDLQGYANFLTACANDPRFNYDTLMAAIRKENPDFGWFDRLIYAASSSAPRRTASSSARARTPGSTAPAASGPAGSIRSTRTRSSSTCRSTTSVGTVDLPSLWNQRMRARMWLHWDGNNDSVEERNKSAAIGAGATPDSLDLESHEAHRELDSRPQAAALPGGADRRRRAAGRAARVGSGVRELPRGRRARRSDRSTTSANVGTDPERLNSFTPELAARHEHHRRRASRGASTISARRTATPTCRSTACGCARRTCTTGRCRRSARCSFPRSARPSSTAATTCTTGPTSASCRAVRRPRPAASGSTRLSRATAMPVISTARSSRAEERELLLEYLKTL